MSASNSTIISMEVTFRIKELQQRHDTRNSRKLVGILAVQDKVTHCCLDHDGSDVQDDHQGDGTD